MSTGNILLLLLITMATLAPCPVMNWEAQNLHDSWRKFKQHVELTFAGPLKSKSEAEKVNYLLIWVGEKGRDVYNTWTDLTDDQRKKLATYYNRFETHVKPKHNTVFARYKFHHRQQETHETFDQFVTDLKLLVIDCEYDQPDEMVRDRIVCGITSDQVREKLLQEGSELKLDKTLEIVHAYEASQTQLRTISSAQGAVNKVTRSQSRTEIKNCYFCGRNHARGNCPAWGAKCDKCGKLNHWQSQCDTANKCATSRKDRSSYNYSRGHSKDRSKDRRTHKAHRKQNNAEKIHYLSANSDSDAESLNIQPIIHSIQAEQLQATLKVHGKKAKLITQVDTGAEANILPTRCFKQLFPEQTNLSQCTLLAPTQNRLLTYDGTYIPHHGVCKLTCSPDSQHWHELDFYVCDSTGPIIIGLKDSRRLDLISISPHVRITVSVIQGSKHEPIVDSKSLTSRYPDRFCGQGKFPHTAKLQLKPDATPVVHAPRRCPVHLKNEIEQTLQDMEDKGIIEKIPQGQPTEWLSSLAYARKSSGKLRVCLDPRDLNKNLKRTYHRAMTVEEITHKLADATVLSKLDAKDGYWSIQLDTDSSLLTAFSSPSSNQRYKFNRLPFGLCVAQDLFQEAMDKITSELNGVISIADDICVYGKDEEEHDRNLHNLMVRARACGLVFNANKCFIKVPEISFFGAVYSKDGIKPDPERTKEIQELPAPNCKQKVLSFLGMVQYLSAHIPHLSELTAPLRNLTKKDAEFIWTGTHQDAFNKIKHTIAGTTTLSYFNPKYHTKIQVDSSKIGLGAALIQVNPEKPDVEHVIAYASKSLSEVESRYANIERECLAVVYGVEKFHTYVYGKKVTVESDHKPLEAILTKNLAQAPPRLQRMMLRLQPYDIDVKYRKGSELLLADFLSRYKPNDTGKHITMDHTIHSIQWSDSKLQGLRMATAEDQTLSTLLETVKEGWPSECRDLPKTLKPYWTLKDYISIDNGILLKGEQIIVPESYQHDILSQLHNHSHQGIEKTQMLARKCVYWPNINTDISNTVGKCHICNTYCNSQRSEPMHPRELPSYPWEILGSDIFELEGQRYLLLCDYFSKFFITRKITNETSSTVIQQLKLIFSEHGIPSEICTDNGPCYSSKEFRNFVTAYGFKHTTSSPHYPQSNGFAERMVGTVKKTIKKCIAAGEDIELALLLLRTTPIANNLPSPAELLYGRPIKSILPTVIPFNPNHENTKLLLKQRQDVQKQYFDRGKHEMSPLSPGDPVMLQSPLDLKWKPATVVSPTDEPRSYLVQDTDGGRHRRNRKFLRKLPPQTAHPAPDNTTNDRTNDRPVNDRSNDRPVNDKRQVSINETPSFTTFDQSDPVTSVRPHRERKERKRLIEET